MKINNFFRKNAVFFILVGIVLLLEIGLFLWYGGGVGDISLFFHKSNPSIKGVILFEGTGCTQCDKVDTFIKNNHIEDTVAFTRLEVFNNNSNADILADKAQICGLDPSKIGVPFLWDGAHCIIGYVDVINFFKTKITEKKP